MQLTHCQRSSHAVVGEGPFTFSCPLARSKNNKTSRRSLTLCAQSLTAHDVGKNCDHSVAAVCVTTPAATSPLAWVVAAVQNCKANKTLTWLRLDDNKVGDAGAAALANALKATVLTCKKCVFTACVRCHRKCRFTKSSEEWPRQLFWQGAFRCFCLWIGGKRSLMSVSRELRAGCSQVDVTQCQNQTGLFEF